LVSVNVEDAEIYVDGEIIGFSPLGSKRSLSEGAHELRVQAAGFAPLKRTFRIEADRDAEVEVRFKLWGDDTIARELDEDLEELEGVEAPARGGPIPWDVDMLITGGFVAGLGVVAPLLISHYSLSSDQTPNPRQSTLDTLHTIEIGSAIGAGLLIVGGIALHFSGWLDP
jgi:hypothetical protein